MKRKALLHIFTWVAFYILIWYGQSSVFDTPWDFIHSARILLIGIVIFYFNQWLLDKFFRNSKYLTYSLIIVLSLTAAHYFFETTMQFLPRPNFPHRVAQTEASTEQDQPERRRPENKSDARKIMFTAVNTLPILFFSTIFWLSAENRKQRQREIALKNENLTSEMRFLKSQINPHFLFNALNNIYSLSITKSEKAPEMLMKLSDMLRHVVYDSSNKVSLDKEIAYIHHFIDFQKLKTGNEINVTFEYHVENKLVIEPMLLIPFIENAFKHSDVDSNADGYININLTQENHVLKLAIVNSIANGETPKDEAKGIGIENVKKRLELSYPNKYHLDYSKTENTFEVQLKIELQ